MNYCHYKIDRYFLFVLGIGTGLGHITGIVVIGYNFDRRLSLASGVAVSGVGVGMLTLSTMMQFARDYYGDFGFFMFLAGVYFHLVVFGMVCFPSSLELGAQTKRKLESKENSKTNFNISSMVQSYLKVGLNKGCLCLCFAMFTYCFSTCLLYLHLPEYIISKGFQAADGTFLLALSGVTTMIGRFLTGLLQNFKIFTGMFLYIVTMIIVAIASGVAISGTHLDRSDNVYRVSRSVLWFMFYIVDSSDADVCGYKLSSCSHWTSDVLCWDWNTYWDCYCRYLCNLDKCYKAYVGQFVSPSFSFV